jgi:hypothetical protein
MHTLCARLSTLALALLGHRGCKMLIIFTDKLPYLSIKNGKESADLFWYAKPESRQVLKYVQWSGMCNCFVVYATDEWLEILK